MMQLYSQLWVMCAFFQGFNPPVLVFVQSIERAKELFHELIYEGINVDVIHADRTQQQVKSNVNFQSNKEQLSTGIYEALVFHSQTGTKTFVVCSVDQRDNTVHSFRAGKIWVLICTALLARGIDFKGVNLVINYDFPTSSVEYIHRIGESCVPTPTPHSSVLARLPESLQHVHFQYCKSPVTCIFES